MKNFKITKRMRWKDYVTPKPLKNAPIHRWLVFPHSFSGELVEELAGIWGLKEEDHLLDPFSGAGTTLVAAKKLRINATGFDISPFAVFASKVKTENYDPILLKKTWKRIKKNFPGSIQPTNPKTYPDLVTKALSQDILWAFENLDETIQQFSTTKKEQSFFRLALFKIMPEFSNARASGGWLKWVKNDKEANSFFPMFSHQIDLMLHDIIESETNLPLINTSIGDARFLSIPKKKYSAVITSPPYPNRHDYTRIFGVELMYGFLNWEETRTMRYQTIHSHPEAKPNRPDYDEYVSPKKLSMTLKKIQKRKIQNRLNNMFEGYFIDLYCCFRELAKVTAPNANIAIILGNAQYYGEPLLVDEIAADIGEQVGLHCTDIVNTRMRGNSAQQMKTYGRNPSRESVIFFKNK